MTYLLLLFAELFADFFFMDFLAGFFERAAFLLAPEPRALPPLFIFVLTT